MTILGGIGVPFTFSHAAAAIPIIKHQAKSGRRIFDVTALILGNMAPDFEFYVRLRPLKLTMEIPFGHTLAAFPIFNLPLCILFA